ncbi:MAG TPA: hypothetical protein VF096_11050 [Azonexus sp.]
MLFHVYDDPKPDGYYVNEPFGFYRTMLDADWLLYILLPLLLVLLVAGLMLAWHVHEIPKHKAEKKKMRQADLVSALTLLGLLEHWVWAVALFIAFMDWDAVEAWLVGILRKSRTVGGSDLAAEREGADGVPEAATITSRRSGEEGQA